VVDKEKLRQLAISSGVKEKIPLGPDGQSLLGYYLLFDEAGKLVKVKQFPPAPIFPEIERALAGTQVVAPGRRGQEPVRSVTFVRVDLK
jgi:hypothetical protein